jgi:capping protein beta
MEEQPIEKIPDDEQPLDEKIIKEKPIEEKHTDEKPNEEKPIEEKHTDEKPNEEKHTDEKPLEEKPIEENHTDEKPLFKKSIEDNQTEQKVIVENPKEQKHKDEKVEVKQNIVNCIKIIQRMPLDKMDDNITAISNLIYDNDDLLNEFLQKVDNRTEISKDDDIAEFIKCEHNRDGDSYRSPHSNKYFPETDDAKYPSKELRELEVKLNKIFGLYSRSYYSTSTISSVYCWDTNISIEDGFSIAILIKNAINIGNKIDNGTWESNNVIRVSFEKEADSRICAIYKLTSSVTLCMSFIHPVCGKVSLSGSVTRQVKLKIKNRKEKHIK